MFDFFAQAWAWLTAINGGGLFDILKTLVELVLYFPLLGIFWM